MNIKSIYAAVIAACALAVSTNSVMAGPMNDKSGQTFYDRKSEGWFWYEPEPIVEPEPEPEPEKVNVVKAETKESSDDITENGEVVVNVKWLRENLPKIRDAAIDDPTYDKVARYFYTQRVMMDKASKFASVAQQVSKLERPLDETLRRPDHQTAAYDSKLNAKLSRNGVFKELDEKMGLFFFYSSSCGYCAKQAPLLDRMARETGIDVLAVSLDGRPLPTGHFPEYVTDPGTLRQKLRINYTPTIYVVTKDGEEFHNVAAGLIAPDELKRRIVMLAAKQKWISEDRYNETKEVKEILLADSTKEQLTVDPELVYSDPDYLAKKLRQKFDDRFKPSTSLGEEQ